MECNCSCCDMKCKNLFINIYNSLMDVLMNNIRQNYASYIPYWSECCISYEVLHYHCVYIFFQKYTLNYGEDVPLGRLYTTDAPEYKRIRRYFRKRAINHNYDKNPMSIYDIIMAEFITDIRQETLFFNYAFDDRIPDKKNYPTLFENGLMKDFKFINNLYQTILTSNDSYFLKSLKFFTIEHITYFEHFYSLAKILKSYYNAEERKEYSYYAYNLRYVKAAETGELIFFPFMFEEKNINRLYFLENTCSKKETTEQACIILGQMTQLVEKTVDRVLANFVGDMVYNEFDVEHCGYAEEFFRLFFGNGQHIQNKDECFNDINFDDIRIMYRRELSFEALNKKDTQKREIKKNLNSRRRKI